MSALSDVFSVLGVLASVLAGAFAGYLLREILLQRRGEQELVSRLIREEQFRRALLDYWEVVDRDGLSMTEPMVNELARIIEPNAAELGERGRLVEDALRQPSIVGRTRYIKKLMSRASRELQKAS